MVAVLTVQDMDDLTPPPPPDPGAEVAEGAPMPLGGVWSEPLLAVDRVRYVGEPVAIVITNDSYQGEDAAELVSVDYEPLPAVVGIGDRAGDRDPAVRRRRVERPGDVRRGHRRLDLRRL